MSNMMSETFIEELTSKLKRTLEEEENTQKRDNKRCKSLFDQLSQDEFLSPVYNIMQEKEPVSQPEVKFMQAPFGYDFERDCIVLDASAKENDERLNLFAPNRERINLFSRHIQSYKNNAIIQKHCAPWGNASVLCCGSFRICKKVFDVRGNLVYVLLRDTLNENEFFIDAPFFTGWTDDEALKAYTKYVT